MASKGDTKREMRQSFVECDGCETGNEVRWYCLNCKVNLCDECKKARLHRNHLPCIVQWTSQEAVTARQESYPPCKLHPQKTYTNYCQTCGVSCCPFCISDHMNHTVCTIDEASATAVEEITSRVKSLQQDDLPQVAYEKAKIEKLINENEMEKSENKTKLRNKISVLKKQLENIEKEEDRTIDQMHKNREDNLRSHLLKLESLGGKINNLIEFFTQKMSVGSKVEMKSCLLENPAEPMQSPLVDEGDILPSVDYKVSDFDIPSADISVGATCNRPIMTKVRICCR